MKTKTLFLALGLLTIVGLFSFKSNSGDNSPKTILISVITSGENEGFVITYGDGKKEVRPFNTKIKALNPDSWVQNQLQTATILNEFKEKGYHYVGTYEFFTKMMILEKD